jgi:phosphonate transport system substrate-binding protein
MIDTRRRIVLSRLAALMLATTLPLPAQADHPLVLGVYPFASPTDVENRFNSLASYLSLGIGHNVVVRIGRDYTEHLNNVARGDIDIAFVGPGNLALLSPRIGRWPLLGKLRVGTLSTIDSVIAVRQDSPLRSVAELAGQRIAFTNPHSTTGYHLPKAVLREAGVSELQLKNFRFVGNDENVAMAVLAGDADAGALKGSTYRNREKRGLRVLAAMPTVPEHVFVAGPQVPTAMAAQLTTLLQTMADNATGRAVLGQLFPGTTAIVAADWAEYLKLADRLLAGAPR